MHLYIFLEWGRGIAGEVIVSNESGVIVEMVCLSYVVGNMWGG